MSIFDTETTRLNFVLIYVKKKKINTVTLKIFYAEKNTHKAPAGTPTKEMFIVLYILIQLL